MDIIEVILVIVVGIVVFAWSAVGTFVWSACKQRAV